MKLALSLPTDVSIALRRAAKDVGGDLEIVAVALLKDALIAGGWLEVEDGNNEDEEDGDLN